MPSQRDVKDRISSVKNIQKITRAMEMVAGARLRRAEQRIAALRPYADALRRMTRQAAQAAGAEAMRLPLLSEHDSTQNVGVLLVTGDRGLAGGFNSQIIRAGVRISAEYAEDGLQTQWYATGRRGVSSLNFRGHELSGSYTGFAGTPAYAGRRSRSHVRRSPRKSPSRRTGRRAPASPAGPARWSTTSRTPRRYSSGWSRTTSRSRNTEPWWSRRRGFSARR